MKSESRDAGRPTETPSLGSDPGRGEYGPQNKTWNTASHTHARGQKVEERTSTSCASKAFPKTLPNADTTVSELPLTHTRAGTCSQMF